MTRYILRDADGNIIDEGSSPFESETPVTTKPVSESYEEPATQQPSVEEPTQQSQPDGETYGLGQGVLAGIEETNTVNPFGGLVTPIAAGLVTPFSDKTYGEIKDEMERRQEARRNIGRAAEGDVFGGFREATQKTGEALKPIEDIMMGNALLGAAAKTKAGIKTAQALSKVPGLPKVASVASKTLGSRDPRVRAGSFAGLVGSATLAKDLAQGKNLATSLTDATKNAALVSVPTLAAGYLPAWAFYPSMVAGGIGTGYVSRKAKSEPTNASDIIADALGSVGQGRLLRTIIPEDTAYEKGSKYAKAVDVLKKPNKQGTNVVRQELATSGYDESTPFYEVPSNRAKEMMKYTRRASQTAASDIGKETIQTARLNVQEKLREATDKQFPLVREIPDAQKAQSKAIGDVSGKFDKTAASRANKRWVRVDRLDKLTANKPTERHMIDEAYDSVRGLRGPDGELNREYLVQTMAKLSKESENTPAKMRASKIVKKLLANSRKDILRPWNKADALSNKSADTVKEIAKKGTPENAAYRIKNTIWKNTHKDGRLEPTTDWDKLQKMNVPEGALPEDLERLANQHDYLVDMEQLANAPVSDNRASNLLAKAAASQVAGGELAKYNVSSKINEWLGTLIGRQTVKQAANTLRGMTLGDVENLLETKWGNSMPLGELLTTIRMLPKTKEKRK